MQFLVCLQYLVGIMAAGGFANHHPRLLYQVFDPQPRGGVGQLRYGELAQGRDDFVPARKIVVGVGGFLDGFDEESQKDALQLAAAFVEKGFEQYRENPLHRVIG